MKAAVYQKYGPPEVLHFKEVEKPKPKDNEVLIKIHATTVTAGDVNARGFTFVPPGLTFVARLMFGLNKPKKNILGFEFSGTIEAIGKNVTLFKIGDKVLGIDGNHGSAYAEYKCMREDGALVTKPNNMTHEEAASVSFGALTALYFLREKANIQKEPALSAGRQKVLINGASGSVGSAAVQLAKHFGAEVTGVCSTANLGFVKSLGADKVIDYTKEDFTQSSETYDIILDTVVGKTSFLKCKKVLKKKGFYLAVAGGIKELFHMMWTSVLGNKKVIFGGGTACEKKEYLNLLKGLIEAGKYNSVIDKIYPFEQIVEAHRYVDKGHKKGNVVITIKHNNQS